jgi:hypothetical protein
MFGSADVVKLTPLVNGFILGKGTDEAVVLTLTGGLTHLELASDLTSFNFLRGRYYQGTNN